MFSKHCKVHKASHTTPFNHTKLLRQARGQEQPNNMENIWCTVNTCSKTKWSIKISKIKKSMEASSIQTWQSIAAWTASKIIFQDKNSHLKKKHTRKPMAERVTQEFHYDHHWEPRMGQWEGHNNGCHLSRITDNWTTYQDTQKWQEGFEQTKQL